MPDDSCRKSSNESVKKFDLVTSSIGLGIKVMGGKTKDDSFGIFIKRIICGGAVAETNKVNIGDQILDVNGLSFEDISLSRAVNTLRQASVTGHVVLIVSTGNQARLNYERFLSWSESKAERKLRQSYEGSLARDESFIEMNSSLDECGDSFSNERLKTLPKTIEITKSSAGIGFRVQSNTYPTQYTCCKHLSLVVISSLSPGGDAAEDGRMGVGDYLTHINGDTIVEYNEDQIHSLLLREKLRKEEKFQVTILPSDCPISEVLQVFHQLQQSCQRHELKQEQSKDEVILSKYTNGYLRKHSMDSSDSSVDSGKSSARSDKSRRKRLSLDGDHLVPVEKLYSALVYLGVQPTDRQLSKIDDSFDKDENNCVQYADFVAAVLEVCGVQLAPAHSPTQSNENTNNNHQGAGSERTHEVELISPNEDEALSKMVEELRSKVEELEEENKILQERIESMSEERKLTEEGCREALNRAEQEKEHMKFDYEELIRVLETELSTLQSSEMSLAKIETETDLQKHLSLVECECRKLVEIRQTNEDTVENLLAFINKIVQSDVKSFVKYNKSHEAIKTLEELAQEAEKIYVNVRLNMQQEDLPYGWEEASLSDGRVYYIDHMTHTTSWEDPRKTQVSRVVDDSLKIPKMDLLSIDPPDKIGPAGANRSNSPASTSSSSSPATFRAKMRLI